jgi:DNA repair protein RadC
MSTPFDSLAERDHDAQGHDASVSTIAALLVPDHPWPAGLSAAGLIQQARRGGVASPRLAALHQLLNRLMETQQPSALCDAAAVDRLLAKRLAFGAREQMLAVPLDGAGRALGIYCLGEGTIQRCSLEPRLLLDVVVDSGASRLILAHNHPSGDPTPSAEDRALSAALRSRLAGVGISLVDHVVIARLGFASALYDGPVQRRGWLCVA